MRIRNLACGGLCLLTAACSGSGNQGSQTPGHTTGSERAAMQEREEGTIAPGAEFDPGRTPAVTGESTTVVTGRAATPPGTMGSATADRGAMERGEAAQSERAGVTGETRGGAMDMENEMEPGTSMQEPREPLAQTEENSMCPADIEGLNVRVTSIPSGGAMVFTAATEQVDELRMRLRRFADMHQQHQMEGGAAMPSGATGSARTTRSTQGTQTQREMGAQGTGAQTHEQQALIHQASEVRVIEIPRGARLEIRMPDQQQVRPLRAELREDAEMLRNGNCPVAMQATS